jgi:hypothetical protein
VFGAIASAEFSHAAGGLRILAALETETGHGLRRLETAGKKIPIVSANNRQADVRKVTKGWLEVVTTTKSDRML